MAIGGLPIPTSDAPLIMTAQMDMIAKITAAFGLRIEKEKYMTIIYAILTEQLEQRVQEKNSE